MATAGASVQQAAEARLAELRGMAEMGEARAKDDIDELKEVCHDPPRSEPVLQHDPAPPPIGPLAHTPNSLCHSRSCSLPAISTRPLRNPCAAQRYRKAEEEATARAQHAARVGAEADFVRGRADTTVAAQAKAVTDAEARHNGEQRAAYEAMCAADLVAERAAREAQHHEAEAERVRAAADAKMMQSLQVCCAHIQPYTLL